MKKEKVQAAKEMFQDGMSYKEIAEIMDLTVREVKNLESRALYKLKRPSKINKKFYDYME